MAEEVTVKIIDNGPLYIEGKCKIVTGSGKEVPVKGEKTALCRCGASQNKPFCDGAHKAAGFQATEND